MNFDHIPAKAEMLASDVALVLSDPRWAAARLAYLENEVESLQRENEELKAAIKQNVIRASCVQCADMEGQIKELREELAARTHNYEYWREYAESLKASAITPEMRERMERAIAMYEAASCIEEYEEWEYVYAIDAFRDRLGEKDA